MVSPSTSSIASWHSHVKSASISVLGKKYGAMRTSPLARGSGKRLQFDAIDITSDLHKCAGLIEPTHDLLHEGEEWPSAIRVTSPQMGLKSQCDLGATQFLLARLAYQEKGNVFELMVNGFTTNPLTNLAQVDVPLVTREAVTQSDNDTCRYRPPKLSRRHVNHLSDSTAAPSSPWSQPVCDLAGNRRDPRPARPQTYPSTSP